MNKMNSFRINMVTGCNKVGFTVPGNRNAIEFFESLHEFIDRDLCNDLVEMWLEMAEKGEESEEAKDLEDDE